MENWTLSNVFGAVEIIRLVPTWTIDVVHYFNRFPDIHSNINTSVYIKNKTT